MSERFGDLRSAIARRSFADTCVAIERWPEDAPELLELALPYAHEHLASWPGLRHAPDRWCDAVYSGARPPWLSVANAYSYTSRAFRDGSQDPFEEPAPALADVLAAHDESLRALYLNRCDLSPESWPALTHALHLRQLEVLDVFNVRMDTDSLRRLVHAPFLSNLKGLTIGGSMHSRLGADVVGAFIRSGRLDRLEVLSASMMPLHGRASLPGLKSLRLQMCDVEPSFIGSVCGERLESFTYSGLLEFDLSMAEHLVRSDTPALRELDVGSSGIRRAVVTTTLLQGRHVRRVERLALGGASYVMTGGTSDLAADIARSCERVKRLELPGCQLGDDALDALAQGACAATLTHLDLSRNAVGERALRALVSGAFPALTSINLSGTEVRGLSTLHAGLRRGALPELELVTIEAGQIEGGCTLHDAIAAMREFGVKLDPGVGFMRPRRTGPS